VFDALVRRAGVVRVNTILQLFASRGRCPPTSGPAATAWPSSPTAAAPASWPPIWRSTSGCVWPSCRRRRCGARQALPPTWSHANPLDIIGDATAERYRAAVEACLADDNVDGVLVMLTPQAMTRPTEAAQAVIEVAQTSHKPVLTCWMGEAQVFEGRACSSRPAFPTSPRRNRRSRCSRFSRPSTRTSAS
jgi:acetyltransferase